VILYETRKPGDPPHTSSSDSKVYTEGTFSGESGFVNGTGAVCDQKILIFVLQMEKIQAEHVEG
jgi:phosphoribosyl-AMP cyclohydrolase